jgi:acetylornithine deacetylase/succinyl-diaminopimelate desuccinylase-like protein
MWGLGRRSGDRRGGPVEPHARQPVQPHHGDQGVDLGLRAPQQHDPAAPAQTPGEHGQVQHQGGVCEGQLGQVDDEVTGGPKSTGQRSAAQALGSPILVAGTSQDGRIVRELDDPGTLYNPGRDDKSKLALRGGETRTQGWF